MANEGSERLLADSPQDVETALATVKFRHYLAPSEAIITSSSDDEDQERVVLPGQEEMSWQSKVQDQFLYVFAVFVQVEVSDAAIVTQQFVRLPAYLFASMPGSVCSSQSLSD